MVTSEHAPGRRIVTHGDGAEGIALLWHGRGPCEAYALGPLADAVADDGLTVMAADWDASDADHGRSDLTASLEHARHMAEFRGIDPQRLVVAGWSLGGTAALGLALQSTQPLRTILVAPGYAERAVDAFSGKPLPDAFPSGSGRIDVLWGNRDDLVDAPMANTLATRLGEAGWSVTATELDADHSGVVGVRFDESADRYVEDPAAADSLAAVASAIVAASRP